MGRWYGRASFDPRRIIAQILVIQAAFYCVSLALFVTLDSATGRDISLDQFFSYTAVDLDADGSLVCIAVFLLTAAACGCLLLPVVGRARKCLDFSATTYFIHLWPCVFHRGLPYNWEWWALNAASVVVMSVVGEQLCMRRELAEISLPHHTEEMQGLTSRSGRR